MDNKELSSPRECEVIVLMAVSICCELTNRTFDAAPILGHSYNELIIYLKDFQDQMLYQPQPGHSLSESDS